MTGFGLFEGMGDLGEDLEALLRKASGRDRSSETPEMRAARDLLELSGKCREARQKDAGGKGPKT